MKSYILIVAKFNVIALLIVALLFPADFSYAKIIFLTAFLSLFYLLYALNGFRTPLFNKHIFIFLILILSLNLFFILWGMLHGASNEAVRESFYIYFLYPLFYTVLIAALSQTLDIKMLTVVLIILSMIISYIVIAQAFRRGGVILPGYELLYFIYPGLSDSIRHEVFTGHNNYTPRVMERLIFLAPFSVALLMLRQTSGLVRFFVWFNFILILMAVFASERRAMALILFLAILGVVISYLIIHKQKAMIRFAGIGLVILVVLGLGYGFLINELNNNFDIINNYTNKNLTVRVDQFSKLIAVADEYIFLGKGFGGTVPGYARDTLYPWRFELTYVALFFQTGFLGLSLYSVAFLLLVLITINSYKASRNLVLPYIFGLAGGMLATATNPYFNYGTGQFFLFIPLAVFNVVLLNKDKRIM